MNVREPGVRRREVLGGAVAGAALLVLPAAVPAQGNGFLTERETALLRAITARLIPADAHSPSAAELGVPEFIDGQLAGAFGRAAFQYTEGPFLEGAAQQGFQHAGTPAELYRAGLARLDEAVRAAEGAAFDTLSPERQDGVLHAWQEGRLDLSPVPGALFFTQVLSNTTEGFFADPSYGGNKDMAAWRMIGFPGAHAAYLEEVELHGEEFGGPPVSLADLRAGPAGHAHGHGQGR